MKNIDIYPILFDRGKFIFLDNTTEICFHGNPLYTWFADLEKYLNFKITINKTSSPTLLVIYNCNTSPLLKEKKWFEEQNKKLTEKKYKKIVIFQNEMNWDTYTELAEIENFFYNIFGNSKELVYVRNMFNSTYNFSKINVSFGFGFFPFQILHNINEIEDNIECFNKETKKEFYFFSTNRSLSPQREKFYNFCVKNNFLPKSNSSFIFKNRSLIYDTDVKSVKDTKLTNMLVKDSSKCAIQVVFETKEYSECGLCLSEKVFKAILYGTPFIIYSQKNTLKFLKSIGIKTFDWIFDEIYDTIENDEERLNKVFHEIKKIMNYNIEQLSNFIIQNNLSVEHNRIKLKEFIDFEIKKIYNILS